MTSEDDPFRETPADRVHLIARAAISAIPVAGGPLLEIFNAILAAPLAKRRDEWIRTLLERLAALEAMGRCPPITELVEDEAFVSCVVETTEAARRTHKEAKLAALKNAVLNVACGTAPDDDLQKIFMTLIDRFTPWHLRILALFHDPERRAGQSVSRNASMGSLSGVIAGTFPELAQRRDFYDLIWKDLYDTGLVTTASLHGMMTGGGTLVRRTTEIGSRFIQFIESPGGEQAE